MTPLDLIAAFDSVAEAPNGVVRLRELVLQLAVRGKLVLQDPTDEPASVLLERIRAEKARSVKAGSNRKGEPLPPPVSQIDAPFEVPDGWCWARFTDVARIASNLVDPAEFLSEPHVAPDNIEKATGRLLGYRTVGEDGVTSGKHRFSPGQILYSKIRPNLSKVVIVDFAGLCSADMYPIDAWINRGYLQIFMLSQRFLDQITADDNRLAMPKVNQEQLSAIHIPVPPVAEQHRIVARVNELMGLLDQLEAARTTRDVTRAAVRDSALDALREAERPDEAQVAWNRFSRRMDDLLCDLTDTTPLWQTVLELAVRGKLVPQDPADEPASALLERIAAEKGRLVPSGKVPHPTDLPPQTAGGGDLSLPQGWELSSLADLIMGTEAGWSPKCDSNPTTAPTEWGVLKTTAIQPNRYLEQHHKTLPGSLTPRPELEVAEGDVLVTRAGPWFRVGVAACVASTRPKLLLSDKIIRCRLVPNGVDGAWVALCINTGPGARYLLEQQSGMDKAQMNISQSRLRSAPIPVPPLAEQRRIVARVDELRGLLDRLEERLTAARTVHVAFAAAAVHHVDA